LTRAGREEAPLKAPPDARGGAFKGLTIPHIYKRFDLGEVESL